MEKDIIHNINPTERLVRIAFSLTLATIPLLIDAPIGALALLPLLAIYPGLTGAIGWDPLHAAVTRFTDGENGAGRGASGRKSDASGKHGLAGHA